MIFPQYITFTIIGIYSLVILLLTFGWFRIKTFKKTRNSTLFPVSIVIACRNEEDNIAILLDSLLNQDYPKEYIEINIVDDHSGDNTKSIIKRYTNKYNFINLYELSSNEKGKKEAIACGVKNSSNEIILTTDADCIVDRFWIRNFVNYYQKFKPKIVAGPVCLTKSKNVFQKIQALEFLSLVGSGAGAIGINHPIMNNGANLLFEKSLFQGSNQQLNYASGDDIFLMLQAKQENKKSVHFLKSKDAIVYTQATKNVKDFFNQRIRWTSKSKAYRDTDIIFTALTVSITCFVLVFSFIYSFWNNAYFQLFIILFLIKSLIDLTILIPVSRFFSQQYLLWLFLPLQMIYPFYIIITTILGLAGNFRWKNRSFKEKR